MATIIEAVAASHVPAFSSADYDKMRGIAKAVYDNPALLEDFERDPEATARAINGFVPPSGFHIHIADAANRLHPAEEAGRFGDESRDSWSRVEFRAGYKTFSLVGCM
jgi:hypothetical protein